MKINEIFTSIQGETSFAGLPFTFVRLTGCNLRCSYCDTQYAYEEGTERSIDQVLSEIQQRGFSRIVVTGGEPLLQNETTEPLFSVGRQRLYRAFGNKREHVNQKC